MKLTDQQYATLKWVITIVLPALITFLGVIFESLNVVDGAVYLTILAAFQTFLGAIFKTSEHTYDKERENK